MHNIKQPHGSKNVKIIARRVIASTTFKDYMVSQNTLDLFKVIGVGVSVTALLAGGLKWLAVIFKRVSEINTSVVLLKTNHLPHIQASLDSHTTALGTLASDVRDIDTKMSGYSRRLDDTKDSVDALNGAFIQHLARVQESIVVTVERKPFVDGTKPDIAQETRNV
jgi:hypothetical protein